jgi:hypothetical protein
MITWLSEPEEHDYPAAQSYLTLLFEQNKVDMFISKLKKTSTVSFKAKDILRASELPLLTSQNYHVKHNLHKIESGKSLSPVLLVKTLEKLIIADGYHRICAVYLQDEDADIPCHIV